MSDGNGKTTQSQEPELLKLWNKLEHEIAQRLQTRESKKVPRRGK